MIFSQFPVSSAFTTNESSHTLVKISDTVTFLEPQISIPSEFPLHPNILTSEIFTSSQPVILMLQSLLSSIIMPFIVTFLQFIISILRAKFFRISYV